MIKGNFVILNEGKILSFQDYNDIPLVFDNLISFEPVTPEPPHTDIEHGQMEQFQTLFEDLLKRERYASGN